MKATATVLTIYLNNTENMQSQLSQLQASQVAKSFS